MVKYATTFGVPPTTKAAFTSPEFSSPYWKLQYQVMAVGRFTPIVPGWGEAETSIRTAVANIMSAAVAGNVTPAVITSELQKANAAFQKGIDAGK
jgi:hypothetical protein